MERKVGGIKQIISPNCVVLTGPVSAETGLPMTKFLTLQAIQTPEYSLQDKENPKQENYGFKAREYLRSQLLGAQVEFTVEHKIKDSNDKVIGKIFKNGNDIGEQLLRQGLAQIRQGSKASENYEEAQNSAKNAKKGIWSGQENQIKFSKVDLQKIASKNFSGLIEDVNGLFIFYAYVAPYEGLVKCSFGDIFVPNSVSQIVQNKAKWILQDLILQQEVQLSGLGFDEKFQSIRVDITKGKLDIKKELLSLGLYRLAPNAFQIVDQKRFEELKEAQTSAELKQIGIWKDIVRQTNGGQVQGNKSLYQGKIIEVHSGDSISVLNLSNRSTSRVFLASIKSPKCGKELQAFGFEAREFSRRHAIGKTVRVEVEYEKTIAAKQVDSDDDDHKKKGTTELHMIFVNIIILEDKEVNLAVQLVQNGYASVQPPKGDDGYSRYIEELKAAQDLASQGKKGIHGKTVPIPRINDLTVNPSVQRNKDAFDSLKQQRKLTGVVDLVLNGSRYKVRFNELNCSAIVLLSGIKCLPNDQNLPDYQKYSNIALQYSKEHIQQRDVEIELESIDKKGIFHGHIFFNKRVNIGQSLLELGLGVSFNLVPHRYTAIYKDAEEKARALREGLWGIKNLDLSIIRDEDATNSSYKLISESKQLVLVEIADSNTLYFQDPQSKVLGQIEKLLSTFTANEANKLVPPFKKGLQVVAKFSVDGKWYRAKILRELKNKYEVLFVDYGNVDQVHVNDIRKLPDNLGLPFQAQRSHLAYLAGPSLNHEYGSEVGQFIRDQIFEKSVLVEAEYTDDVSKGVIIHLSKDKAINKTLNYVLLSLGYAKLDKETPELPKKYAEFLIVEQEAKRQNKGVWNCDEDDQ